MADAFRFAAMLRCWQTLDSHQPAMPFPVAGEI
jgi:hypothetical protein